MEERRPDLPHAEPDDAEHEYPVASNDGTGVSTRDEPFGDMTVAPDSDAALDDAHHDLADEITSRDATVHPTRRRS